MRHTAGGFTRVDITKPRLAAMKLVLGEEIERQRLERVPSHIKERMPVTLAQSRRLALASDAHRVRIVLVSRQLTQTASIRSGRSNQSRTLRTTASTGSVVRLGALARRYRWEMERAADEEARRRGWQRAA
jgi:hypothetical protein